MTTLCLTIALFSSVILLLNAALFYATLTERRTGESLVFEAATLAITISVLLYGPTATPASRWLHRRMSASVARSGSKARAA